MSFSTDNSTLRKDIEKQLKILEERLAIKNYCLEGLKEVFKVEQYLVLRAKASLQNFKPVRVKREFTTTEHPLLLGELRQMRSSIARSEDIPPFQVFTQESLFEFCGFLPRTGKELRAIKGMGKVRVEKYGAEILEIIINYCLENKVEPKENILEIRKPKKKQPAKGSTQQLTFDMFKAGSSIKEIAEERGLVVSTIESHLVRFINKGELKAAEVLGLKKYEELKTIIDKTNYEVISELKAVVGEAFSYSEIRMVIADLANQKA